MSGNITGQNFRVLNFGESHGQYIGAVIDGCPPGLILDMEFIQAELDKRKPGQNNISSSRMESDSFEIVSGVFEGKTLGTPICLLIKNTDAREGDYEIYRDHFRPSHADFTYQVKYGIRDHRGGGRASARETASRVAAGAIARMILFQNNISVHAFTKQIGNIILEKNYIDLDLSQTWLNDAHCPDLDKANEMIDLVKKIKAEGDSIGGVVQCVISGCPAGLGEPVFDKFEAELAKAMLGINACKGFEIGSGFESAWLKGTENTDDFYFSEDKKIRTTTNHAGGVAGGITNGEDVWFNVAFKPTPSFSKHRKLMDINGNQTTIEDKTGRYDPCVVPRAVAVVEAMAALVTVDMFLRAGKKENNE